MPAGWNRTSSLERMHVECCLRGNAATRRRCLTSPRALPRGPPPPPLSLPPLFLSLPCFATIHALRPQPCVASLSTAHPRSRPRLAASPRRRCPLGTARPKSRLCRGPRRRSSGPRVQVRCLHKVLRQPRGVPSTDLAPRAKQVPPSRSLPPTSERFGMPRPSRRRRPRPRRPLVLALSRPPARASPSLTRSSSPTGAPRTLPSLLSRCQG